MWERASKKRKNRMSNGELLIYFYSQLKGMVECPNQECNFVLQDICASVVRYLCWFQLKSKYEQVLIMFQWYRCSSYFKKSNRNWNWFGLPY